MIHNKTYNDVIFEFRNKTFGAYQLRLLHNTHTNRALIATLIFAFSFSMALFYYINFIQNPPIIYESIDYRSIIYDADEVFIPNIKQDLPPKKAEASKSNKENLPPTLVQDTKPITKPESEIKNDTKTKENNQITQNTSLGVGISNTGGESKETNNLPSISNDTTGSALYTNEIFIKVDQGAEFAGGKEAFATYLKKNIIYPTYALENKVNGIVFVHIVVNRDGTLQDFRLYKGIEKSCNDEVMRVAKAMPNWIPARKNGISVRQRLIIPINFNATQ